MESAKGENQARAERKRWEWTLRPLTLRDATQALPGLLKSFQLRMANNIAVPDHHVIDNDVGFRQILDHAYPHVALRLVEHFRRLIDANIIAADEIVVDVSLAAIREAA